MIFRLLYGSLKVRFADCCRFLFGTLYACCWFFECGLTGCLGIKAKVENKMQYDEYLKELEPLREELGISLKETMYPE